SSFRRNSHKLAYPSSAQHLKRLKSDRRKMNSTRESRSCSSRARSSRERSAADDGLMFCLYHAMNGPRVTQPSASQSGFASCRQKLPGQLQTPRPALLQPNGADCPGSERRARVQRGKGVKRIRLSTFRIPDGPPRGVQPADRDDRVARALRAAPTRVAQRCAFVLATMPILVGRDEAWKRQYQRWLGVWQVPSGWQTRPLGQGPSAPGG